MQKIEIIFYQKANGSKPAEEFIESLSKIERDKVSRAVKILVKMGRDTREPYSKHITQGIYELRADRSRVLYFFVEGNALIFTNGFIKKTQKTPRSEIDKARRYREDYLKRSRK